MGFKLAEAFVEIGARTVNFDRAVSGVKRSMRDLKGPMESLHGLAGKLWFALAGAGSGMAALAVKAFADAERETQKLRSALEASLAQAQVKPSPALGQSLAAAVKSAIAGLPDLVVPVRGAAAGGGAPAAPMFGKGAETIDQMMKRLEAFAAQVQRLTVYEDDAVKGWMAMALNLGVAQDQLEEVTKLGIGLGEAFFGGDAAAGITAVSKALQGNFRELQRIVPGMKDAATDQDKLNAVIRAGNAGWRQAQDRTRTLQGQMLQLKNAAGDVAENFGGVLAPKVAQLIGWLQGLAARINSLSDDQRAAIVRWAGYAAAVSGVILLGPRILSLTSTIGSALLGLGRVALASGRLMLAGLFTPIGAGVALALGALAALATGFMYAIGSGDTFAARIRDGFGTIVQILDPMLGSWKGFVEGITTLWDQLGFVLLEVWVRASAGLQRIWEELKFTFKAVFYSWGQSIAGFIAQAMGAFRSLAAWLKNLWDRLIDAIADKFADAIVRHQAQADVTAQFGDKTIGEREVRQLAAPELRAQMPDIQRRAEDTARAANPGATGGALQDAIDRETTRLSAAALEQIKTSIRQQYGGRKLSGDELGKLVERETQLRVDDMRRERLKAHAQRDKEYDERMRSIDAETNAAQAAIGDWARAGLESAAEAHQAGVAQVNDGRDRQLNQLERERKDNLAHDLEQLQDLPKLSDHFQELVAKLKSATGVGEAENLIEQIKGEAAKVQQLANGAAAGGNGNLKVGGGGAADKPQTKGIEELFKENLLGQFAGMRNLKEQQAHDRHRAAVEKQTKATQDNTSAMLGLIQRLSNPLTTTGTFG